MARNTKVGDPIRSVALLEEPNRARLYDLVSRAGEPIGRDAAAEALGISRELAAFHLDRLAHGGLLTTEFLRLSGRTGPGAGRPSKLYRRTEGDVVVSLPQRNYDLAADVMAQALEELGPRGARALQPVARERGRLVASHLRASHGSPVRGHDPREPLLGALRGAGYEPEVEPDGSVLLRNCPYDALALDHRDLTCGMSAAWAEGVVDALATPMRVVLAPAQGRCCVVFRPISEPIPA